MFCLAEGPSQEAVERVHQQAHGAIAPQIIEIDPNAPLNALFGEMPHHPPGTPYTAPAMRAIVFTDVCGSVAQTQQLGDAGHMALLREHNEIVRAELATHDGREVKHTGDGIMAAFASIASAVAFAVAVQRALRGRNENAGMPIDLSIGISAGEPVTDANDASSVRPSSWLLVSVTRQPPATSSSRSQFASCVSGRPLPLRTAGRSRSKASPNRCSPTQSAGAISS